MTSGSLHHRATGVRVRSARETLHDAMAWSTRVGLSRVTALTRLDRIGCPVYAGVRPRASASPISFGKGMLAIDAKVGAYMEAIETYCAEPGACAMDIQWCSAREIAGARRRRDAALEFAPIFRKTIDLDAQLLVVRAHDVETEEPCWIPAELVYHPAPAVGQTIFGSSTNGLASGNSIVEASAHALAEVIERDIWSFERIRSTSRLLDSTTLPRFALAVLDRIADADLECVVREVPNGYGLAFFAVFIFDPQRLEPALLNGGWGCHTDRGVSLSRALCEAAQSRLAFIHGLRSLPEQGRRQTERDAARTRASINAAKSTCRMSNYHDVPTAAAHTSLENQWERLVAKLRQVTDRPIYRVLYTGSKESLQVVRIIVPTLEDFRPDTLRIGKRLRDALDA